MFYSCLIEKHVYRGYQSTNEPEASEGEFSRTGNSRLNHNSHKRQIVVSNVTKYLLKRKLILCKSKHQIRRLSSHQNLRIFSTGGNK